MMRNIVLILMLAFMVLLSGCNIVGALLYPIFGGTSKKVDAEYEGLEGKKIAIFMIAGSNIEYEYSMEMRNLPLTAANLIGKHVKDVSFVDANEIWKDKFSNETEWISKPISTLAKQFGAERVIYIEFYDFTIYAENSINLLQGQARATVKIYEIDSDQPDRIVHETRITTEYFSEPRLKNPEQESRVRSGIVAKFADELAKKFYDHKTE
ncbi:MAG: hypothetical protein JEZ07_01880 [Phycisphaerae bacterium]|nr:hypothetical protein [Phycisphaerae bacterium]